MPKANPDKTWMGDFGLDRPIYVLKMNWWHFSDANRLKWLKELREAILRVTLPRLNAEINRRESALLRARGRAR